MRTLALPLIMAFTAAASPAVYAKDCKVVEAPKAQSGRASWYGPGFHGRKTANGEVYDMHAMTAAHRSLKLGTRILVENVDNGQSVVLRVNDRGPYVGERVLDVSKGAAQTLGFHDRGLAPVKISICS